MPSVEGSLKLSLDYHGVTPEVFLQIVPGVVGGIFSESEVGASIPRDAVPHSCGFGGISN